MLSTNKHKKPSKIRLKYLDVTLRKMKTKKQSQLQNLGTKNQIIIQSNLWINFKQLKCLLNIQICEISEGANPEWIFLSCQPFSSKIPNRQIELNT